jgi:hypothetical protein
MNCLAGKHHESGPRIILPPMGKNSYDLLGLKGGDFAG